MSQEICQVAGLCGEVDLTSPDAPNSLIWQGLVGEWGPLPQAPFTPQELLFDDSGWLALPSLDDLRQCWDTPSLAQMLRVLATKMSGGVDLGEFLFRQRMLLDFEAKEGVADVDAGISDVAGAGEDATRAAVAAIGGGAGVSCGSEDGDAVGEGEKAPVDPHPGRASKVSSRRRRGKAA